MHIERVKYCLEAEYTKDACQSRGAGISGRVLNVDTFTNYYFRR